MSRNLTQSVFRVVAILLGLGIVFELVTTLVTEILWFQEVGYLSTFLVRLKSQLGLWIGTTTISILFLLGNLRLAKRLQWQFVEEETLVALSVATIIATNQSPRKSNSLSSPQSSVGNFRQNPINPQSPAIKLPWLFLLVLGFSLLIGLMLLYYSEVALQVWQPNFNLANVTPPLPSPFKISSASQILPQISQQLWKLGIVLGVATLLLLKHKFWLRAIAFLLSLVFGLVMAGNWLRVLQYFNPISFNQVDPQFGNDISLYVFKLPFWKLLDFWFGGLFLYGLVAVSLTYLLAGNSISDGKFPGFSRPQLRHLYALEGAMMLVLGLRHGLNRYELLYSSSGVSYGANYTDIYVQLPLETGLSILAIGIAFWFFWKAIIGLSSAKNPRLVAQKNLRASLASLTGKIPQKSAQIRISFSLWLFCTYVMIIIIGTFTSTLVQYLVVQPNELAKEKPYIERSITFTRAAFGLNNIDAQTFNPTGNLTAADLQKNNLTIDNIRLWDTRPLLQTNRQLQQIRLYYKFLDADIDRYLMKVESVGNVGAQSLRPHPGNVESTEKQQVIIAARELDYTAVPKGAQTWVNQHLIYTHGYGFTLSPVNQVDKGGLPYYFVKDIGTDTEKGALRTSNELIRASIPIGYPRIYYGELTNTYVMTSTKLKELDFPSGQDNIYNVYDGTGGINIGSGWRRLLFAQSLKDWQMLFTENFKPDTRLLFRRNINRRIREIAPFFDYDHDPYLVVADAGDANQAKSPNYLHWMMDAYTTSDGYPYSDPGTRNFNYIRNSVKIVVDAYNGDVDFYIADPNDPIIQSWQKIFPGLFKPIDAMPASLYSHIRYPEDLFSTQSERLLTYHMTDPQVFYNREDQWEIPNEIYGGKLQPIEPYYLIMKLPTATSEEFILLNPYTPTSRPNLIAWLAGRSDDQQYGKILLYQFPKEKLVYGPDQIEALINQDPIISERISLWNREGSKVIQGNLLIIPIEQSLLYVEPLYLEAEQNSLPTLARVIVVYQDEIAMEETLEKALAKIFN